MTVNKTVQLPPIVHTFPAPAVLIGCGTMDKPNLITCSWFGTVCSEPPMVSVSIRPERFSFPLVRENGEFSVNIMQAADLEIIKYCGSKSGRDGDKFKALNLTPAVCHPLNEAPMIEQCPLVLACVVKQEIALGTHHIFIAEVVKIHADEALARPSGRPDPFPEDQVVYLDGKYWRLARI